MKIKVSFELETGKDEDGIVYSYEEACQDIGLLLQTIQSYHYFWKVEVVSSDRSTEQKQQMLAYHDYNIALADQIFKTIKYEEVNETI